MPDIFLYPGETSQTDIRLRDSTVSDTGAGSWNNSADVGAQIAANARKVVTALLIAASAGLFLPPTPPPVAAAGTPLQMGGASPRVRSVYYQARFEPPPIIQAPVVTPYGWWSALSTAPTVLPSIVKAQVGFSSVPFNTVQPSVASGIPINAGDAPPSVRTVYYQSRFEVPPIQQVILTTPYGWWGPLSTAPLVAKAKLVDWQLPYNVVGAVTADEWQPALSYPLPLPKPQQGFSSVPFDTAQLSINYTNIGWYQPLSTVPPVVKVQVGFLSVPFDTAQLSVNFTIVGWQQTLSGAPTTVKAQPGFASVPFNTAQLSVNYTDFSWYQPLSVAVAVAKAQAGFASVPFNTTQLAVNYTLAGWQPELSIPRPLPSARQGLVTGPFNPANAVTADEWQPALSGVPAVTKAQQGFSSVPFNTAQIVAYTDLYQQPLSIAVPVARAAQGGGSVPFDTAQVLVNYTPLGWYQPLSTAPVVAKPAFAQWQLFYTVTAVVTADEWQPALSGAPPAVKAREGFSSVPSNTAQVVVYTDLYQQPLSIAPVVVKARAGFSSVPFDTAQLAVNYTDLGWYQSLSRAPVVAKPLFMQWPLPYGTIAVVTADEWQPALSGAPLVAKAQAGFASVPFNTAQLFVTYTDFGWYQPLSLVPPVVKQIDSNQPFPFYTIFVDNTVTIDKWQPALSSARAVTKAQPGFASVPLNTVQIVAASGIPIDMGGMLPQIRSTYCQAAFIPPYYIAPPAVIYTNFGWYQPLSSASLVAKVQQGFAYVPFNIAQLSVNFTDFDWQQPLSTAPSIAKVLPAQWQLPYSVITVVTADEWQSALSVPLPLPKAREGFASVPFNTAQLSVNYTVIGWYQPLSVAPPVTKRLDSNQPYPFYSISADNNVSLDKWQPALSTASPVAKAQQGFSYVPFNTAQVIVYADFWQQPLSVAALVAKANFANWQLPYVAPRAVTADEWQSALSNSLPLPKAQVGFSSVPLNTAQLSVNYTSLYQQPLSVAVPITKVQQGFASVPFNTAQLSNSYTDFSWYQPLSTPSKITQARMGISFTPLNTAQNAAVTEPEHVVRFIGNVGSFMIR